MVVEIEKFMQILGSLFLLISIIYIYIQLGSTNLELLLSTNISYKQQLILFITFIIPFAVKIPMIPFHIWLGQAHVEANTSTSIILAAII